MIPFETASGVAVNMSTGQHSCEVRDQRGGSTIRSTQIPDSLLAVNSAMDNGQADSLTEVLQIDPECCNLLAVPANLFFRSISKPHLVLKLVF